jgi:epoxyqueuosine reductase
MQARVEERCDPRNLLPGARSVVMVMMGYREPRPPAPPEPHFKVARYAARRDYHNPMLKKLRALRRHMKLRWPGSKTYVSVDTGAVLERSWAQQSGLGFIGKNTMLLSPTLGTYTVLGALLTTVDMTPDAPFEADLCARCTACMDACPTAALIGPRVLDARQCITTWTVENPQEHMPRQAPPLHGWVFGCDECQEACPWQARGRRNPALMGRPDLAFPLAKSLTEDAAPVLHPTLAGTPLARAKVKGLLRNARSNAPP